MLESLGELGLKAETVAAERKISEGLAVAYLRSSETIENNEQRFNYLAFSATAFRRAGAHALLLDDVEAAAKSFASATRVYTQFRMPYALMTTALAGNPEEARKTFYHILEEIETRQEDALRTPRRQWAYMLVYSAAIERKNREESGVLQHMRKELQASVSSPIGVLGLPVGLYLNLADSFVQQQATALEESLMPFLGAYDMAVRHASLNVNHWQRMVTPFHPAEPDTLSVLILVHHVVARTGRSVLDLLKRFPLSWQSRLILEGTLMRRFGRDSDMLRT